MASPPPASVSGWLEPLKKGDAEAAIVLWDRYCERLVRLAREKLRRRNASRCVADEEDIALSAFNSLCLGARNGRFPDLADRGGLWGLLVFITAQKAADWVEFSRRKKRGGGKVRGHSAVEGGEGSSPVPAFDRFFAQAPGPETLHIWAAEYERLLERLGDATLRNIAELRVQGHTVDEIADKLSVARRTVHRKLNLIRKILSAEFAS